MCTVELTERKIAHLKTLIKTKNEVERRISQLQREISKEMIDAHNEIEAHVALHEVSANGGNASAHAAHEA